jgi:hypothetical protein
MPIFFLDSSALVKAYRREEGTPRVIELLGGSDPLILARLAQVEVSSALTRRGRSTGTSSVDMDAVLSAVDHEITELFQVIELSTSIMTRAVELTRVHALRAADAIQLACALLAREQAPRQEFIFVGSDQELNAAARAEQIQVLDPTSS